MPSNYRIRRTIIALVSLSIFFCSIILNTSYNNEVDIVTAETKPVVAVEDTAMYALSSLLIKGRAPKTDYSREKFGNGWISVMGCDTRNIILNRDLKDAIVDEKCNVKSGILSDPYTGNDIIFQRGSETSGDIQIDHVVALSDAWQKGAQQLTYEQRQELANDPLELLAVDGPANLQKSDSDAASWLPSNKSYRCSYVARQIAIKQKYSLWVTQTEHDVIVDILNKCPGQILPKP